MLLNDASIFKNLTPDTDIKNCIAVALSRVKKIGNSPHKTLIILKSYVPDIQVYNHIRNHLYG